MDTSMNILTTDFHIKNNCVKKIFIFSMRRGSDNLMKEFLCIIYAKYAEYALREEKKRKENKLKVQ